MLAANLPRTAAWLHAQQIAATGVRAYLASVGLHVDAPAVRVPLRLSVNCEMSVINKLICVLVYQLISLSLSLFLSIPLSLSVSLSLSLSPSLSLSLSLSPYLSLSLSLSLSPPFSLSSFCSHFSMYNDRILDTVVCAPDDLYQSEHGQVFHIHSNTHTHTHTAHAYRSAIRYRRSRCCHPHSSCSHAEWAACTHPFCRDSSLGIWCTWWIRGGGFKQHCAAHCAGGFGVLVGVITSTLAHVCIDVCVYLSRQRFK